ncbi:hypothetical protein SAMN02745857_03827 [Andreprevotia lacus DSM 23236]|jgi:hypothetical protein|uniref:Uncharacterized protein n=1 Tax=Andreprevotia lacus DSM 23236 TaxID=1121001 RepID=A0A1W1XZM6_9NEIS|nr:hypothetical protein [Andreprevotia lacus]SMC29429.1 hypothetical protein SAMN02745857_03827 [Andreprevotia lacus DSM 23236]
MFNSSVLETLIGLVACYAALSLLTSSIYEAVASALRLRASNLLQGVQQLLNETGQTNPALTLAIYNNALVHPTGNGTASSVKDLRQPPSYIEARHFAEALVEQLAGADQDAAQLKQAIDQIPDLQLRKLMQGLYQRSAASVDQFKTAVAGWFDTGMARLSGAYKRRSQLICLLIALLIAVVFNLDTFLMFNTLWHAPALNTHLALPVDASAAAALQYVNQISPAPIGWAAVGGGLDWAVLLKHLPGWLITASAVLFGAPFWFDLLQRFVQLRGTGGKPADKAPASQSSTPAVSPATAGPPN